MTINQFDGAAKRLGRRAVLRQWGALAAAASPLLAGMFGRTAWGAAAPTPPPGPPGSPPDKEAPGGVTIKATDPAIAVQSVQYSGAPIGTVLGYVATPVGGEIYPGILVVHDAIGLTEHIKDITRRLARNGYVALAPDLLSPVGGTGKYPTPQDALNAIQNVNQFDLGTILNASVRYLEAQPLVAKTRIGVIGFGFGGNLSWQLVGNNADIKVAVVFDAETPDPGIAQQIQTPILVIDGETDTADTDGLKQLDDAMKAAGDAWQYKIEPKAGRAFFDDSRTPYVADASKDAWKLTMAWFEKYLRS